MARKYDVIVVGAGNGGLMAAACLAKRKKKVLLIDRHNIAGGAASSFIRGRFEFETALHELCDYGHEDNPRLVRKLYNWLGIDVKMHEIPDVYRYISTAKDGFDVRMPTGKEKFIKKLDEIEPGYHDQLVKFFKMGEQCMNALGELAEADKPNLREIAKKYPAFLEYATKDYESVLKSLGLPKKIIEIMEGYWCYIDIPADEFEFPYFATMLVTYVENGAYIPDKRSHEMSTALVENIRGNGGEIWLGTEVEKIIVENGQAVGVQLKDEKIFAEDVICNVIPQVVYSKMMDEKDVPKNALKLANAHEIGTSGFLVYLGLNKSAEELGVKDYSTFICSDGNTRKQFEDTKSLTDNDFMIMNCINTVIPNASPKGTCIMFITQLYDNGSWDNVKPEEYEKIKEKIARKTIKEYEDATGIKISDSIEEIAIAAPPTLARYMRTPNGEIYGYHSAPWDQL